MITDGHVFRILAGGATIANVTTESFSVTRGTRTRSHKDVSQGFTANDYGEGSWEASAEGLYEDGSSFEDLYDAIIAKTKLTFQIHDGVTGHTKYSGNVLVTNLELGSPDNEDVTFSCTLTGDGAPVKGTV